MTVDLRSDTVTRPTAAMRSAMAAAEVGDDVFGDDPTVNALQDRCADLLGTEAGLYLPSGTQSNLVALLTHCGRGDEYVVGFDAHTYSHEGGGAAALGAIQPQPIAVEPDGTLDPDVIDSVVKPRDAHFARTRLVCLEDTKSGVALPVGYHRVVADRARSRGLALHLDGARIWNSAVANAVDESTIAGPYDTVSVCLSKGLGAPVGSVLCGSKAFLDEAHRWRKVVGGGMRQAGIIAAAGLYALDHHRARLADDHANAQRLADGLAGIEPFTTSVHTNMVMLDLGGVAFEALSPVLSERGVVTYGSGPVLRLVTHLDIDESAIDLAVDAFAEAVRGSQPRR